MTDCGVVRWRGLCGAVSACCLCGWHCRISAIDNSLEGKTILVRGRVHTSRATGNNVFVVLRQAFNTVQVRPSRESHAVSFLMPCCCADGLQAVCIPSKTVPKDMAKYIEGVPKESIVDVEGEVVAAPAPILSTSQQVCTPCLTAAVQWATRCDVWGAVLALAEL